MYKLTSTHILCAKIAGGQSMLVHIHPHLAPPSLPLFPPHPQPNPRHLASDSKVAVHKIGDLNECITIVSMLRLVCGRVGMLTFTRNCYH